MKTNESNNKPKINNFRTKITKVKVHYTSKLPINLLGFTDWNGTFEALQQSFLRFGTINKNTIAYDFVLQIVEGGWINSAHWVYKKKINWNYRIPSHAKRSLETETRGDVVVSIINIAENLWFLRDSFSDIIPILKNYENPGEWTKKIVLDLRTEELRRILNPDEGKQSYIKHLRKNLEKYKVSEEPQNPHNKETEIHLWRLVEASILIVKSHEYKNFEEELWIGKRPKNIKRYHAGFIHAWSTYTTFLDKCPTYVSFHIDTEGKLFVQGGRQPKQEVPQELLCQLAEMSSEDVEKTEPQNPCCIRLENPKPNLSLRLLE